MSFPFFKRIDGLRYAFFNKSPVRRSSAFKVGEDFTGKQEGITGMRNIIGITAPCVCVKILRLLFVGGVFNPGDMYRIEMKVSGDLKEITVHIDEKRLVSSLIEMTGTVMCFIEIACIGYIEMTHEVLKICLRGLDDDMEMVGHKDKGEKMDLIDLKGVFKDF